MLISFAFPLLAFPAAQQLHLDINGSSSGTDFGHSASRIGDLDGDGVDDIVVGAPREDRVGEDSGSVYFFSSASGAQLMRIDGAGADHFFGHSLAGLGDINGDGVNDIAISSRRDNSDGLLTGMVGVYSGADGSLIHQFNSSVKWDRFAHIVVAAGDLDADGIEDILIGAPNNDWSGPGSGSLTAWSGATGDRLHLLHGANSWDLFGWSAAGVGDINNDGSDDFAVGAPRNDSAGPESGTVTVFSGATGAPLLSWHGQPQDGFGYSICAMGDANVDGQPDLAVGGLNYFSTLTQKSGFVEIRTMTGNQELVMRLEQESRFEAFGSIIAAAGDLNGDGAADLMVGAPSAGDAGANGLASGSARLFSGLSGGIIYRIDGDSTNDKLASSLVGLGDLNMDGFADFLISEPGGNPNSNVYIYYSEPTATLAINNFIAGATATASVTGTHPNAPLTILFTTKGFGSTTYPSGVHLDLAEPISVLGTQIADSSGNATLSFQVPIGTSGVTTYFQGWSGGGPPPGSATIAIKATIQ